MSLNHLMKNIIVILPLFFSNLTFAQIENRIDTLEIWTLNSIGNFVNKNAERIVEKNWPFKIKGIAGDVFFDFEFDSVQRHNDEVWALLDKHGYTNSKKKFESDFFAEKKRIKKVVDISNMNEKIISIFNKLKKNGRQNYVKLNKLNDFKYEILLYSFNIMHLDKEETFEQKYIVDLKNEKIQIIE